MAFDEVRTRQGQSIESIMLDMIQNPLDGLGTCTTVECLLEASLRTAKLYIMDRQTQYEAARLE